MRYTGFSWRKFRPHQCPHCIYASVETITHNKMEIPRNCEQPPHKPFLSPESTNRDCKHFKDSREIEGVPARNLGLEGIPDPKLVALLEGGAR